VFVEHQHEHHQVYLRRIFASIGNLGTGRRRRTAR
jgi:hypothetical protein